LRTDVDQRFITNLLDRFPDGRPRNTELSRDLYFVDRIAGFHSSRDNRAANDLVNLISQRRNPIDDRVCKQSRERVIGCHKRSLFHLGEICYSNITVREH
jgi:hypothetical protein